jgi:hypothetical protein
VRFEILSRRGSAREASSFPVSPRDLRPQRCGSAVLALAYAGDTPRSWEGGTMRHNLFGSTAAASQAAYTVGSFGHLSENGAPFGRPSPAPATIRWVDVRATEMSL